MAGGIVSRTAHFALHRSTLDAPVQAPEAATGPGLMKPKALFDVDDVWMGAMVPKRWARRAVTRNAIKRQIYNVSATSEILKQAVRAELEQLFQRVAAAPAVAATEPRP